MNTLNLYLVEFGAVMAAEPDAHWNGIDSVLVAATCAESALLVAEAYERGLIGVDNLHWRGKTIAAVALYDNNTGEYL